MTLTYVVPVPRQAPTPADLAAAVVDAFRVVHWHSPEHPRAAVPSLTDRQLIMAAEYRLLGARSGVARSIGEMRSSAGSRSPTPEENALFDQLFAELPTDDEG